MIDQVGGLGFLGKNLPFLLNFIGYLVGARPDRHPDITAALKVPAARKRPPSASSWDGYQIATDGPEFLGIDLLVPLTLLSLPIAGLLYILGASRQRRQAGLAWARVFGAPRRRGRRARAARRGGLPDQAVRVRSRAPRAPGIGGI